MMNRQTLNNPMNIPENNRKVGPAVCEILPERKTATDGPVVLLFSSILLNSHWLHKGRFVKGLTDRTIDVQRHRNSKSLRD